VRQSGREECATAALTQGSTECPLRPLLLLCSFLPLATSAEVLIDTDFGAADQPVAFHSEDGRTDVTGALPAGWGENSTGSWQPDIAIKYTPVTEDGRRFLRIEKVRGGNLQLAHSLPDFTAETFGRLTVTARSLGVGAPQFGIRFNGAPYSMPWEVSPNLTSEWTDYVYDFRLEAQPQSIRLQISHGGSGQFDLRQVKLERFTRDELIAQIKAAHPEGGQGNLAAITRFPLGLPSGWCLDRDDDDAQIAVTSDDETIGPSGTPAMHIAAPGSFRLRSAPFAVPWSFEQHTLSLSIRSAQPGRFVIIGVGGRYIAEKRYEGQPDWQRIACTFQPVLRGEVHGLAIEGSGEVWIDALQVERGTTASAYQPAQPCEAVLACPPSEVSVARLQFEDEPAKVAWAVTGNPAARLRLSVTNLYGETKALPPTALTGAGLRQGVADWTAGVSPKYGAFRITAAVEDASGKPLSAPSEVVINRLRRPRYWGQDAPNSPFGAHTLPATRHLIMAKAAGVNWVRLHDAGMQFIGWSWLETERGKWTFFDDEIHRYRANHLSILGQFETAPHWATGFPKPCVGYWDRWFEPQNLDDWANYVRTVTTRYRDDIRHWEVWNEPWGSFWSLYDPESKDNFKRRSPTAAEDYAKLQAATYRAAKAVDPTLTIVGFNSYGAQNGTQWTKDLLDHGAYETCDVFSWHKYTSAQLGFPTDDIMADGLPRAASPVIEAKGKLGKPAWMSEGTTLRTSTFDGFYQATLPYPNADDWQTSADNTVRYVLSTLASGADRLFLYTMHGLNYFYGSQSPNWRALLSNDGYLHPAALAHSNMAWLLEDTRFVKVVEPAQGVFAYVFEGQGRAVAALVPSPNHAACSVPGNRPLLDLFGNPPVSRAVERTIVWVTGRTAAEVEQAVITP